VSVSRRCYRIEGVLQLYDPEDCSLMCVLAAGKGQHADYWRRAAVEIEMLSVF